MSTPAVLEVAEAMWQNARQHAVVGHRLAESLDEAAPHTQKLFLERAEAAIAVTGSPAASPTPAVLAELIRDLAEHLAWKLNHPAEFWDGVRGVLERYAEFVGEDRISDEVREAMQL